jgi:hypothetical protein
MELWIWANFIIFEIEAIYSIMQILILLASNRINIEFRNSSEDSFKKIEFTSEIGMKENFLFDFNIYSLAYASLLKDYTVAGAEHHYN